MGARLEQTTGWGRAPLQGTCRRVAILQGTGGEAAGGKGGHPTAGCQAVRWFTSPFRAGGLVPTPSPPVPVCKEEQVAKGGERGRGARPPGTQLPHVARRRRGHPQPQPAPLTWSHSRRGQGRLAGLGACQPRPALRDSGAHVPHVGGRAGGARATHPRRAGRSASAKCQALPLTQSARKEGGVNLWGPKVRWPPAGRAPRCTATRLLGATGPGRSPRRMRWVGTTREGGVGGAAVDLTL